MKKSTKKSGLHPRNVHTGRYDLPTLCNAHPSLAQYIQLNPSGEKTVNFSDANAVKALNTALLKHFYQLDNWDIPQGYLCPPIPGRADYIHYIADLLASSNGGAIPTGKFIKGLDVGTGANAVYPIIGNHAYQWQFVGSDIDKVAFQSANLISESNPRLRNAITVKHQKSESKILEGIIEPSHRFHFSMCNPPFHSSAEEAQSGSQRKVNNLQKGKAKQQVASAPLNFGGQNSELWCEGGETAFIKTMIEESKHYKDQCLWFTSLVAKKEHLTELYRALKKAKAIKFKTIDMAQGQKVSRFIAWTFQPEEDHLSWFRK